MAVLIVSDPGPLRARISPEEFGVNERLALRAIAQVSGVPAAETEQPSSAWATSGWWPRSTARPTRSAPNPSWPWTPRPPRRPSPRSTRRSAPSPTPGARQPGAQDHPAGRPVAAPDAAGRQAHRAHRGRAAARRHGRSHGAGRALAGQGGRQVAAPAAGTRLQPVQRHRPGRRDPVPRGHGRAGRHRGAGGQPGAHGAGRARRQRGRDPAPPGPLLGRAEVRRLPLPGPQKRRRRDHLLARPGEHDRHVPGDCRGGLQPPERQPGDHRRRGDGL